MRTHPAGFTLIEMLVSVTILLLMVGGGIATFINFNDKQTVLGGVKELQQHLRIAQQKAQIGDKPDASTGCDKLESYVVQANAASPVTVQTIARCTSADVIRTTDTLDESLTLQAPLKMSFRVLQGGVANSGSITIVSATTNRSYTFAVTAGGEITEGAFN